MSLTRKNYWSLDVAKFFCSILIISAHFASEWASFPKIIDYGFSLYIIAVPFFFCCSGFLFFKKWLSLSNEEKRKYLIKYQKRIWTMYGCWSVVYVPFSIISWIKQGAFNFHTIIKWVHRSLVITTYPTIWFLPALAIGIAITCFLVTKFNRKTVVCICVLLYLFGMFGYTYNFALEGNFFGKIMEWYLAVFSTSRNGVFNGVPFIFMGYIFAKKNSYKCNQGGVIKAFVIAFSLLLCVTVESLILKIKFFVSGMDIGIFIVPFTYYFFEFFLRLDLKENKCWLWCRKLSLLIFVSQRMFLSALPIILPTFFGVIYSNNYIGLFAVLSLTIIFSIILIKSSEKFKFVNKMI